MSLLRVAFRNLFRQKRQTFITAIAIALGLGLYIYMDSMLTGLDVESTHNLIFYESAAARVHTQAYAADRENLPLDEAIYNVKDVLDAFPADVEASPRISFSAEIIVYEDPFPADGSLQAIVHAVDPHRDEKVFHTLRGMRFPQENSAILGAWLAEDLGAEVGFPLTVVTRTQDGYFQTFDLEVAGLITTPNPQTNRMMFITLDYADEVLNMRGSVTEIDLQVPLPLVTDYVELSREITRKFPGLQLVDWRELGEDFLLLAQAKRSTSGLFIFIVLIIVVVGISNTLLMAVQERTREIGVLRALGMRDREIRRMFFFEAVSIGFIGSLGAIVVGILGVASLVYIGIDYSQWLREMDMGYRVSGIIRGSWNLSAFGISLLLGTGVSGVVSMIPVRRALKKSVVDELRS